MQVDTFSGIAESMLEHNCEEDTEEGGGYDTALFHSTAYVEGLRVVAIKLDDSLHVIMEGLDNGQ